MATADPKERRDFMRNAMNPIMSGIPGREGWRRKLIMLRAALPGVSAEDTVNFADKIVAQSDQRHSVKILTPFGEVELLAIDTAALTWVGDVVTKGT